jgi:Holliday junction DNA helicase RuvA
MIVNVRGVLEATGPDWVHLRVGGVTLQVFVPANGVSRLGPAGGDVSLHTHLRMRDEQPVLYGFPDAASLRLFTLLTGVAGVGPRLGLSLLSVLEPASLQLAVATGDVAALAAAPGVGRRTASRIILELKGKVDVGELAEPGISHDGDGEVVAALSALGYTPAEARAALDSSPEVEGASVEERIRLALQQFANRG